MRPGKPRKKAGSSKQRGARSIRGPKSRKKKGSMMSSRMRKRARRH